MTVRGVAMTKRPAAPPAAAPKQRFKAEIDSAMKKWHDKAAAEPKHEAPGCAYCMGGGVKPGCVCPKCGDRLPTMEPKDEQVERLIADLREPYTQPNVCEQAADALVAIAAERDQLRDALDMATQGKYSALMLELADGRAEQIHAGIQACVLRGDVEMLTAERDRAVEAVEWYAFQNGDKRPTAEIIARIAAILHSARE